MMLRRTVKERQRLTGLLIDVTAVQMGLVVRGHRRLKGVTAVDDEMILDQRHPGVIGVESIDTGKIHLKGLLTLTPVTTRHRHRTAGLDDHQRRGTVPAII